MKHLLIAAMLLGPTLTSTAQATYPSHRTTYHRPTAPRPAATVSPKVYVCGGGSAYAYHSSDNCAGLNRCSHGISAVAVAEAEGMGRRPCKKCY
jgi:hypothetical protein